MVLPRFDHRHVRLIELSAELRGRGDAAAAAAHDDDLVVASTIWWWRAGRGVDATVRPGCADWVGSVLMSMASHESVEVEV